MFFNVKNYLCKRMKRISVVLIGYGKMGQEIESILLSQGHTVAAIVDQNTPMDVEKCKQADVAIEFTMPEVAMENIEICAKIGLPIVVGTTGWYSHYPKAVEIINNYNSAMFTATNFSIGVHLFFETNRHLAKLMNQYKNYEPFIEEIHHTQKKDAPSGTAITTAENILNYYTHKDSWNCIQNNAESSLNQIQIDAKREENVPGTHTVAWKSEIDTIEITHIAHSRKGFAQGAVDAAIWLAGKKGIFTMKDLLGF